jgi:hypothetical protein
MAPYLAIQASLAFVESGARSVFPPDPRNPASTLLSGQPPLSKGFPLPFNTRRLSFKVRTVATQSDAFATSESSETSPLYALAIY